jgi:acyl-CoA synthetase (AMP-forming)/AMP-acid ligase II
VPLVLGDILRRNASVVPHKPAYVYRHGGDRTLVTYGELNERANQVANALLAAGVARGDRVALLMRNNADMPVILWGVVKAGAVAMPLNFRYTAAELAGLLRQGRPRVLVVEPEYEEIVASAEVARALDAETVVCSTGGSLWDLTASASTGEPAVMIGEDDPHILLCTSGTTGPAKGVLQSHRAYYLQTGNPVFSGRGTGEADTGLVCYQLFHSSGWRSCLIYWRARATAVFLRRPEPDEILAAVEEERITQLAAVPETLRAVVSFPGASGRDLSSVEAVNTGTSPLAAQDIGDVERIFGAGCVRVHYGASEVGPVSSLQGHETAARPTSVGRPTLHVDVRIADPTTGGAMPAGGVGEITVRSDYLMLGYRNDAEATAKVIRDGWYHTGDLGQLDDQGFLYVTGRLKDVIRSGGESVYPAEVEACLREHPGVVECAVVAMPDPQWGECVAAAVVGGPGVSEAELLRHLASRLAPFKRPRHLVLVQHIPRTEATAKPVREAVRALIAAGITTD